MAEDKNQDREGKTPTAKQVADVGVPNSESFRELADDVVPEKDADQKAYKRQIQADSAKEEAQAKAERVESDSSPDAQETPSGAALLATSGIANDTERGGAYARAKDVARRGVLPAEDVAEALD